MLKFFRRWLYPKDENRTLDVIGDAVLHIEKETGATIVIVIALHDGTRKVEVCTNEGVDMVGALDYVHELIVEGSVEADAQQYTKYECKQHLDLWLERLSVIEQQEQTI